MRPKRTHLTLAILLNLTLAGAVTLGATPASAHACVFEREEVPACSAPCDDSEAIHVHAGSASLYCWAVDAPGIIRDVQDIIRNDDGNQYDGAADGTSSTEHPDSNGPQPS